VELVTDFAAGYPVNEVGEPYEGRCSRRGGETSVREIESERWELVKKRGIVPQNKERWDRNRKGR
jgi:hypothetical protein